MRVKFGPSLWDKNGNLLCYKVTDTDSFSSTSKDKIRKKIVNKLKRKFESIDVYDGEFCSFRFNDPADEAFFLVWSSEGIEI